MSSNFDKFQKRRLISSYFSVVLSVFLVLFLLGVLGLFIINSNLEGEFQLLNGMGQLIESFAIGNDEANSKELYIATAGIYYVRAIADGTIQRIVVVE